VSHLVRPVPIRNQRAFLFDVAMGDNERKIFVVGPLQSGERLLRVNFQLVAVPGVGGTVSLNFGASDSPIDVDNFLSDATSFVVSDRSDGGFAISFGASDFVQSIVVPIFRDATDRERFFAIRIDTLGLTTVLGGMVGFAIEFNSLVD